MSKRGDSIPVNNKNLNLFLRERLFDKEKYFIGLREGYLNLYYKGASAAKIEFYKSASIKDFYDIKEGNTKPSRSRFAKDEVSFETHKAYINNKEDCKKDSESNDKYIKIHFNYFKRMLPDIIKNIGKHHELSSDEKIVQQKIINSINSNDDSKWYYVDMEYIKPNEPTGRFDMIAISREKYNGKHKVAIIELKVGSGSYGGMSDRYYDKDFKEKYIDIKENENGFYKDEYKGKDSYLSFGSGVVGHITNFMRFLSYGKYDDLLKGDIVSILAKKKAMGILEVSGLGDIKEDELMDKPELYLVSYTHNPNNDKIESISDLKNEMIKYIFSNSDSVNRCSKHSLEELVHTEHIKEIVNKDMEDFLNNTENRHTFKLNIGKQAYNLHFIFVDSGDEEHFNCDFL